MPWRQEAMKDVVNCEKLWGVETGVDPEISEWGNPTGVISCYSLAEYIGRGMRTGGTETSNYPQESKSTEIPQVAASERGTAQTGCMQACRRCTSGVVGPFWELGRVPRSYKIQP